MERARIAEVEEERDRRDRGAAGLDVRDRDLAADLVDQLAERGALRPELALERAAAGPGRARDAIDRHGVALEQVEDRAANSIGERPAIVAQLADHPGGVA